MMVLQPSVVAGPKECSQMREVEAVDHHVVVAVPHNLLYLSNILIVPAGMPQTHILTCGASMRFILEVRGAKEAVLTCILQL